MAESKTSYSRDKVLIPISGAFNVGLRTHLVPKVSNVSTATAHFQSLRNAFEEEGGWAVEEPLVIPLLGLQPIARTYFGDWASRGMKERIDHKMNKHPDKQVVLVGHSLGGLLVARYVYENHDDPNLAGGICIDSPHLGQFGGPIKVPSTVVMHQLIDRNGSFTEGTAQLARNAIATGASARVTLIATSSEFIDPVGALPNFAGAKRILLTNEVDLDVNNPGLVGVTRRAGPKLGHLSVLIHGVAGSTILEAATDIMQGRPVTAPYDRLTA